MTLPNRRDTVRTPTRRDLEPVMFRRFDAANWANGTMNPVTAPGPPFG